MDTLIINNNTYEFSEPEWVFDYDYANKTNNDRYLIRLLCRINGEKVTILGSIFENPKNNPNKYIEIVEHMKQELPGQYERGEIIKPLA